MDQNSWTIAPQIGPSAEYHRSVARSSGQKVGKQGDRVATIVATLASIAYFYRKLSVGPATSVCCLQHKSRVSPRAPHNKKRLDETTYYFHFDTRPNLDLQQRCIVLGNYVVVQMMHITRQNERFRLCIYIRQFFFSHLQYAKPLLHVHAVDLPPTYLQRYA